MGKALAVVCCLWSGNREYTAEHVNVLYRMVSRHLSVPHTFVCMTLEAEGFDDGITLYATPPEAEALGSLSTVHGPKYPSSYRRLWLFSKAATDIADRILLLDIDVVITGSLDSLIDRPEDFVGWRPTQGCGTQRIRLAGGTWLLRTGTHRFVYDTFRGDESIDLAHHRGFGGSDQAWISHCLAATAATWSEGVGSVRETGNDHPTAPLMHFNGPHKPWDLLHIDWVRESWR